MEKIKLAIEESKKHHTKKTQEDDKNDASITTKKDLEEDSAAFTYEFTKVIPVDPERLANNRIVSFNKNNQLSITFDILRTQVIKKMMENGWRTLAITSPTPGCGKTVLSINLAMSIAHYTNKTSLLVDFDMRRPSVAKYLGINVGPSTNEVLSGDATVSDALVNPGLDRMVVLPTLNPVNNSSELLSSRKVANLIKELRDRYEERIVIFDMPPVLGSDDAMIMMSQVDCVLVVIGNGMVSKVELMESMKYVDSNKLLGTVLNKVESPQSQQSYY